MVIILMGVSGAGKTTIGKLLAERLGWTFIEGDDFHPPANIEKMKRGVPLNDEDRHPWLLALGAKIRELIERKESAVVACSALRERYRKYLMKENDPNVRLVYLQGDEPLILHRLQTRGRHFFKPELLSSQFQTLEEPENAFTVSTHLTPGQIVDRIVQHFSL